MAGSRRENERGGREIEVHGEHLGAHLGQVVAHAAREARDVDVRVARRGEVVEDAPRHVTVSDVEEAVCAQVVCHIHGGGARDAVHEVRLVRRRGHDERVVKAELGNEVALDLHALLVVLPEQEADDPLAARLIEQAYDLASGDSHEGGDLLLGVVLHVVEPRCLEHELVLFVGHVLPPSFVR